MKYIINILILLALVASIVLRLKHNKETVQEQVFHYDKNRPVHVSAYTVRKGAANASKSITGNFFPVRDVKVNSEIQGKVMAVYADEGDYVRAGKVLLRIDTSILDLQRKALDVKIEGFRDDIARFEPLVQADAIQAVKLEKARLGLKGALAQRATLDEKIKKSAVRAPFSGVIVKKMIEPGAFAAPARPLFVLTDQNRMKFTVFVPESELSHFRMNATYPISVRAMPELHLKGRVVMIGSQGNAGNSFPVQLEVKNTPGRALKAGMFGQLLLPSSSEDERILIPATAIVGSFKRPQVYLIQDGKAFLHDVVLGARIGDKVEVKSGLKEGDKIVISGFINLFDGANVMAE